MITGICDNRRWNLNAQKLKLTWSSVFRPVSSLKILHVNRTFGEFATLLNIFKISVPQVFKCFKMQHLLQMKHPEQINRLGFRVKIVLLTI